MPTVRQRAADRERVDDRRALARTALSIVLVKWMVVTLVTLAVATIMAGVFH